MELNEYQNRTSDTAIYPGHDEEDSDLALSYLALGLASESGEVAGKIKKLLRGDYDGEFTEVYSDAIGAELGDIIWYTAQLAYKLGYTLDVIAEENLEKLVSRKSRGTLQGNGDDR